MSNAARNKAADRPATLTIRRITPDEKRRLRLRAAANNRSMEEEARAILRAALDAEAPPSPNLAEAIRAHLDRHGLSGIDVPAAPRASIPDPPRFEP